jgi:hypothetical protein
MRIATQRCRIRDMQIRTKTITIVRDFLTSVRALQFFKVAEFAYKSASQSSLLVTKQQHEATKILSEQPTRCRSNICLYCATMQQQANQRP